MKSRFETEAFDSPEFYLETEEESRGSRRRFTPSRKPARGKRPSVKRKLFSKIRPRPRIKLPIRFPVRPLPVAVWPGTQPTPPAAEPQSQSSSKDAGSSGTPPAAEGDQTRSGNEFIGWVQVSLNKILSLNLRTDGVKDADTVAAIRNFQQREKLPVTGMVGPDTQQALIAATKDSATATPDAGDKGDDKAASDNGGDKAAEEFYFESEPFELYSEFADYDIEQSLLGEVQSEFGMQRAYSGESEFNFSQMPQSVVTMLGRGLEGPALKLAITFGYRSENQLTDLVFYSRHPERFGAALSKSEPGYSRLVSEWVTIRDSVVRPALRGSLTTPTTPSYTPPAQAPASTGGLDIVNVRGIQVARQIASKVESLLKAAAAAGINLGGGGFRSPQQQVDLRRKHCGPTSYDIYEKPSSQCSPPTARPGQSNHEKGLAIDFTYNGSSIKSHDNPGFRWLAANAEKYDLYNLPSEPWHWSVNGK